MSLIVVTFFSSLASPCLINTHTKRLRESGARTITHEVYKKEIAKRGNIPVERLVLFIGTGGTEKIVADFVRDTNLRPPMIIFSHQADNSLPASMEIRTYFERNGFEAFIVHLPLQGLWV